MRVLTILFFAVAAVAASYVSAVLFMNLWAHLIVLTPYDSYAFLSCPFSGKCIEFGRTLYIPTLIVAAGILADTCLVLGLLHFFGHKIKMPEKLKPVYAAVRYKVTTVARALFERVKQKIKREKPELPTAKN